MRSSSYIVDASVAVQWIHSEGERAVSQARALLHGAISGEYQLVSSALLPYELFNALLAGKGLRGSALERASDFFFQLPIELCALTETRTRTAMLLAEQYGLSFYDASYAAIAFERMEPLVTADRRQLGVDRIFVLDIAQWQELP